MSYIDEMRKVRRAYEAMSEEELSGAACAAVGIEEPSFCHEPMASEELCRAAQAKNWIIGIERRQFGCFVQVAIPPHTNDPFCGSIPFGGDDVAPYRPIAEAIAEAGSRAS